MIVILDSEVIWLITNNIIESLFGLFFISIMNSLDILKIINQVIKRKHYLFIN